MILKYRDIEKPFDDESNALSDLMDGLDAGWWMFDRVTFGSFAAVMADSTDPVTESWNHLKAAWTNVTLADRAFLDMLLEGDGEKGGGIISHSNRYFDAIKGIRNSVGPIGLTVLNLYMPKVPTMLVEHMNSVVMARVWASEMCGNPCEEFGEALLRIHSDKMSVLGLKLEKTVFRMNSAFMRSVSGSAHQAVRVFMGAVRTGMDPREAMSHVASQFNLPIELL